MMGTVPKLTTLSKSCNVFKRVLCAFLLVPQLEFAHSRRIDQDATAREKEHLTRGGGVLSTVILFAHRLYPKGCIGKPVYDSGLADAGRAHKRSCSSTG